MREAGDIDLLESGPRIRIEPANWYRWKKDHRWSTWHRMTGDMLPAAGVWTACNQTARPSDVEEIASTARPDKPCSRCHATNA